MEAAKHKPQVLQIMWPVLWLIEHSIFLFLSELVTKVNIIKCNVTSVGEKDSTCLSI